MPSAQYFAGLRHAWRLQFVLGRFIPVATVAFALVLGLTPVAVSVAMANAVGASVGALTDGVDSAEGHRMVAALVVYVAVFIATSIVGAIAEAVGKHVERQVDGGLRERVMTAAMGPIGVRHLEDPEIVRAFETARNISPMGFTPGRAVSALPQVAAPRLQTAAYVVILTWLAWPFGLGFALLAVAKQHQMYTTLMNSILGGIALFEPPKFTFPFYHRDTAITAPAAKEIRVFGLRSWLAERYREPMLETLRASWARRRPLTRHLRLVLLADAALSLGALSYIAVGATRGSFSLTEVTLAIAAVMALSPSPVMQDIVIAYHTHAEQLISHAESIVQSEGVALEGGQSVVDAAVRAIRFEGVSFRYPNSDRAVLSSLDLELRSGEVTAIVGQNGAGKTTLVKLLCRLYEPTEGRILVDGRDIGELDPVAWRRQLAVLFQDYVQYEFSAMDNVRYGALHLEPEPADAAARRAARRVGADTIVDTLPQGWHTPLSSRHAGGVDLSGGQWQKVAFARALMRAEAGAQVLVLDEPTANLDVRAEAELYEQFAELVRSGESSLITVVISHRFSTVRHATRIVVLAEGGIVEEGSHDQLMAQDGLYASMFRAQADRFTTSVTEPEPSGS